MKFSSAVISPLAVVALSLALANAGRQERQVLSMSRFSSSGLVFPGPPNQGTRPQQRSESPNGEQMIRRSAQAPQPVRVRPQQKQLPAGALSMIGKQPEEFIAAAQQRQREQLQQEQQQRAQQVPEAAPKQDTEEEEEEYADEEEFLPRPVRPLQRQDVQRPAQRPQQQQQQRTEEPERPVRPQQREEPARPRPRPAQAQQEEIQRPEPSIQQAVQQRRPNYPANYKPRPQEVNALEEERRRPNQPQQPELEEPEEEEEEVKPDKLQLLLLKTQFNCGEKKDGYYADEEVDCEIFHYCQDRVRHSWLCPEGAIFHQVHLICMPISKENICKKSSQFHFVNDYLYKPIKDEDGNNSTLYADRYYPDGYEPGFDMGDLEAPEEPKLQAYSRRPQSSDEAGNGRRRQPAVRQGNESNRKSANPRRPAFPIPSDEEEDSFFKAPSFPRNENRRMTFRRPVPAEEDFSGEEEEE